MIFNNKLLLVMSKIIVMNIAKATVIIIFISIQLYNNTHTILFRSLHSNKLKIFLSENLIRKSGDPTYSV